RHHRSHADELPQGMGVASPRAPSALRASSRTAVLVLRAPGARPALPRRHRGLPVHRPQARLRGGGAPLMPDTYRVLHLITRLIVGGAQENTLLSVEGLDRLPDFEVTLATGIDDGPEGDLLTRARKTTDLVIIPELGRSVHPFSDLVAMVKVYRLIKAGRYHLVHTHSSKAGVLGRLAARTAGTPIVVHTLHRLVFHDY